MNLADDARRALDKWYTGESQNPDEVVMYAENLIGELRLAQAEIERLGNALARERAKPEGTFDQWARLQQAESEIERLLAERVEHIPDECARHYRRVVRERDDAREELRRLRFSDAAMWAEQYSRGRSQDS